MRKELKKLNHIRKTFVAIFDRYGTKPNWHGFSEKTILLINIKSIEGEMLTDHIWFSLTKGFEKLGNLTKGDNIQFDARVKKYIKGYAGYREDVRSEKPLKKDYKLSHPTKIKIV